MYKSSWSSRRRLYEKNDGQGDNEKNKFNCYDDADYLNCNQCYKFETHSDMAVASSSDLQQAHDQGTILLINYKGSWYGSGTVGDAGEGGNTTRRSSYGSDYSSGWGSQIESTSRYYQKNGSTAYSAAGAASVLLCGFGLFKAYKKATRRCVALASEGGSRTPSPLIELS